MGRLVLRIALPALALVWLAGCSAKLNVEKSEDLTLDKVIEQPIDGYKKEQKITVSINATNPVDVFVYLDRDKADVVAAINAKQDSKYLLASGRMIQDGNLEATIPANSPATVMISPAGKSAKVKYKISN